MMFVQCLKMYVEKIKAWSKLKYHTVVRIDIKIVSFKLYPMIFAKVNKHTIYNLCEPHIVEKLHPVFRCQFFNSFQFQYNFIVN